MRLGVTGMNDIAGPAARIEPGGLPRLVGSAASLAKCLLRWSAILLMIVTVLVTIASSETL